MGKHLLDLLMDSSEDGIQENLEGSRAETEKGCLGFVGGDEKDAIPAIYPSTITQNHDASERGIADELWEQESKVKVSKEEEHFLRASSLLEELIEEELNRYRVVYTQPVELYRLEDVAKFLMPESSPPLQLASVSWLGDWRPTAVLALLMGLSRSSTSFSDPEGIKRTVSELTREARIEEAIIDSELAEIQATCILNLPFAFAAPHNSNCGIASRCIQDELQKIKRVIAKAQQLRFKTLETLVMKVPNPSDAAEFLMTFERIHGTLHQLASQHQGRHSGVTFSAKRLSILDST